MTYLITRNNVIKVFAGDEGIISEITKDSVIFQGRVFPFIFTLRNKSLDFSFGINNKKKKTFLCYEKYFKYYLS